MQISFGNYYEEKYHFKNGYSRDIIMAYNSIV